MYRLYHVVVVVFHLKKQSSAFFHREYEGLEVLQEPVPAPVRTGGFVGSVSFSTEPTAARCGVPDLSHPYSRTPQAPSS